VRKEAVKPISFVDQPWMNKKVTNESPDDENTETPSIYAVSVSKVVMKEGRKTIPPIQWFRICGLLPEESEIGWTISRCYETEEEHGMNQPLRTEQRYVSDWMSREAWDTIESYRLDGWQLAQSLDNLEAGFALFNMDEDEVIASYGSYI
jgi:hypothetical protein